MAEVPYVAPATVEHHRELQEKLQMADHLRQQGNTKEATEVYIIIVHVHACMYSMTSIGSFI